MTDDAPTGASVINGALFFKLLDGSTVNCTCIGEPYATQVAEACRNNPHKTILDVVGSNASTRHELLVLLKRAAPNLTIPEIAEPLRRWWQRR